MCCFSQPVRSVGGTNIFARVGEGGNQVIAYSMRLDAPQDLAMVLPIPVKPKSRGDAVEFVGRKYYPNLFEHLAAGFAPAFTPSSCYPSRS